MRRLTAGFARCLALCLATWSFPGLAHDTGIAHDEPPGWTLDPWITVPLLLTLVLFGVGASRLSRRSGRGSAALARRVRFFVVGWLLLTVALVSPLHQAGERSFGAHMFEHEVIMLAAAPLLILAEPLAIMLWGLPVRYRHVFGAWSRAAPVRRSWRFLVEPVTATLLQAAALWVWHAPALFDLALAHEGWHAAQHLSFLVSALLFWTAMLSRRTNPALAALCLVVTSIVSGALGALMAFATSPWYEGYERLGLAPFGMTPAEDQQLAGLLMWVPGGLVHAGAALLVVRQVLRSAHV
ncbi:cytochrome c oxidase assembly protein [Novosphingobium panipatense]|uniref:cytochrome c oxidase assembly protein n=1 Tax=Novosphingobium panipatense TaxID=428991 RepID=UPI0039A051EA